MLIDSNLHTGEHLANRALCGPERMVQTDERGGFCHAVTLNHGVPQAVPEFFRPFGQRRASGNESPEFPTQQRMDAPESPPAQKKVSLLGACDIFAKSFRPAIALELAQNFALQRFDKSRNRHQHGYALVANHVNQAGGLERVNKDHGAREKRGNEYSQHLAEDVAQRKQVQKAQRVKNALVTKIFLDFTLDWFDVCKDVAVRNHHAARLRRRTGSENNFQRVLARELGSGVRRRVALR